jgi:predicted transcriptional regulator
MPKPRKYPAQADKANFDLEQVKSLSSAIRSQVFWAFDGPEPHSVADIATALGKSAQTVHYHVNELARVGLLIPVEVRKRRARTEQLYVHAAARYFSQVVSASKEYRRYVQKGFEAIAREMVRANAAMHKVLDQDDSVLKFASFRRTTVRLSAEQAEELKEKLIEILRQASSMEDPEGRRVSVSVHVTPTLAESRSWLKAKAKPESKKRGSSAAGMRAGGER